MLNYRDLLWLLTLRDIKIRYAQSVLGVGWAIVQPMFSMLVFTVIFGKLAKIGSDGVPYPLFCFSAMVAWSYFSNAVTEATNSVVVNANMLGKVYFPRLILPLSAVLAKLLDLFIALVMLFILMLIFRWPIHWTVLFSPILVILMVLTAAGLGFWLTALVVQYRDVKYGLSLAMQLLLYAAPVVYPISMVPEKYVKLYALNPMVGVVEGFRTAILGTGAMPWDLIGIGFLTASVVAITGLLYFNFMERLFADVV